MSLVPVSVWLDTEADHLVVQLNAAEGKGDVTLLTLDLKPLSAEDKRRMRHVRPESQVQPPPGTDVATR